MAQNVPIIFKEIRNLQKLGIPEASIKHGLTTMESENWIVSVEPTQITMVELQNEIEVTRQAITTDAAIMHPTQNIIALRSGPMVQIFNFDAKREVKSHTMPESVLFWKWVNEITLAMVTGTSVFHWAIAGTTEPARMFDRHASVGVSTQITNYQVSPDNKWCLLGGISAGVSGTVNGNMQLYSLEKKVSQPLQGHAGAFCLIKLVGRKDAAQVLIYHEKKAETPQEPPKLFVMEIGRYSAKGPAFRPPPTVILVPQGAAADFPVSLVVNKKDEVAFLMTKMGYLYMFDIHTGKTLYRAKITSDTVFCTCSQTSTGAMFGITVRRGQVFSVLINRPALIPYIIDTLRDDDLAIQIAGRLNLPGAEHLDGANFETSISQRQVIGTKLVASSGTALRTPATIARFQQIPALDFMSLLAYICIFTFVLIHISLLH